MKLLLAASCLTGALALIPSAFAASDCETLEAEAAQAIKFRRQGLPIYLVVQAKPRPNMDMINDIYGRPWPLRDSDKEALVKRLKAKWLTPCHKQSE